MFVCTIVDIYLIYKTQQKLLLLLPRLSLEQPGFGLAGAHT